MSRTKYSQQETNTHFICKNCGCFVHSMQLGGQQRNHCPHCLWSLHADILPGDRRSNCKGLMQPIALWLRSDNDIALIHRCNSCGQLRSNRLAADDDELVLDKLRTRLLSKE